jgi:hypothetical protein
MKLKNTNWKKLKTKEDKMKKQKTKTEVDNQKI